MARQELQLIGHSKSVNTVCFSPDDEWVLTGGDDLAVMLWRVNTGECTNIFIGSKLSLRAVCFTPDGRWIISGSDAIRIWSVASGTCLQEFNPYADWVDFLQISHDGQYILTLSGNTQNSEHTCSLIEIATSELKGISPNHEGGINAVALSRDNSHILTGGRNGSCILWSIATGEMIAEFTGHEAPVCSVCYSNDERVIAAGGGVEDPTIRIWDVETGECLQRLRGHTDTVTSICISPDRRFLLSGSKDQIVRLWSIRTGACLRELIGHTGSITSVCYDSIGLWALSASKDNTVHIWNVEVNHGEEEKAVTDLWAQETGRSEGGAITNKPGTLRLGGGGGGGGGRGYAADAVPQQVQKLAEETGVCLQRRDWHRALKMIEQLLTLNPNDSRWLLNKASTLTRLGAFHEASETLQRVVELTPDDVKARAAMEQLQQVMAATKTEDAPQPFTILVPERYLPVPMPPELQRILQNKSVPDLIQLLAEHPEYVAALDAQGNTPLHYAVSTHSKHIIKLLCAAGADLETTDQTGKTPLFLSVMLGHEDTIDLLLENDANPNTLLPDGTTPLYHAVTASLPPSLILLLLRNKANPNLQYGNKAMTLLHLMAEHGDVRMCESLVRCGAYLNSQDADCKTPLFYACAKGHEQVIYLLCGYHAAIDITDKYRRRPLYYAKQAEMPAAILQLLETELRQYAIVEVKELAKIHVTMSLSATAMSYLTQAPVEQQQADKQSLVLTPLHLATRAGDIAEVMTLLKAGELVNVQGQAGDLLVYPLHIAAAKGRLSIVQLLIQSGADIECRDTYNHTPLFYAVMNRADDTARFLIACSARINVKNRFSRTVLHEAALRNRTDIVAELLSRNVMLDDMDQDGLTALHHAIIGGGKTGVKMLLSRGANCNARVSGDGMTPLHLAVLRCDAECVRLLLRAGADWATEVGHQSNIVWSGTPLEWAKKAAFTDIITILEQAITQSIRQETPPAPPRSEPLPTPMPQSVKPAPSRQDITVPETKPAPKEPWWRSFFAGSREQEAQGGFIRFLYRLFSHR